MPSPGSFHGDEQPERQDSRPLPQPSSFSSSSRIAAARDGGGGRRCWMRLEHDVGRAGGRQGQDRSGDHADVRQAAGEAELHLAQAAATGDGEK